MLDCCAAAGAAGVTPGMPWRGRLCAAPKLISSPPITRPTGRSTGRRLATGLHQFDLVETYGLGLFCVEQPSSPAIPEDAALADTILAAVREMTDLGLQRPGRSAFHGGAGSPGGDVTAR